MYDFLIVGSGFSGATLAERIASVLNKKVLVVERRGHIGGNSADYRNTDGALISLYGAHIFHTNSPLVWHYINQFGHFNNYVHHVLAVVNGQYYHLPLNRLTINKFFEKNLRADEIPAFLESIREKIDQPANARESVLAKVGPALYEAFYRHYTRKQWGVEADQLNASVTGRLPVRLNDDLRYFADRWQGLPKAGYCGLFRRMMDHPNIDILLNTSFEQVADRIPFKKLIYTGPIDHYFGHIHGRLPYRSLRFEFETLNQEYFQKNSVINYPNDHEFTRIVEYKYLYQQQYPRTTISREYPCWNDAEPYYPVPNPENRERFLKYLSEAEKLKNVYFCGRLATYKYLNMDQCIGQALRLFEKEIAPAGFRHTLPAADPKGEPYALKTA